MIERYNRNDTTAKKLAGPVRRNHLSWKIGIWFLIILTVGLVIGLIYVGSRFSNKNDDEFMILAFLPICAIVSVFIIMRSGGRYYFYARLGEKVFLEDTQLRNVFFLRYKHMLSCLTEIIVPYEWIRDMFWNAEFHRLEIVTDYRYLVHSGSEFQPRDYIAEELVTDKNVLLYNYFDGMEQMIYSLEQRTGIEVRWKYYDQVKPEAQ